MVCVTNRIDVDFVFIPKTQRQVFLKFLAVFFGQFLGIFFNHRSAQIVISINYR